MKYLKKKEKKAKDPLLQTYFVSLLSLVLCVAMFLGTTFAWFSSDVTSAGNQIYVGTLRVGLSQSVDGQSWTAVSEVSTVEAGQSDPNLILDPNIFWEPGYTYIKWLQVKNEGELSFNYRLKMAGADPNNVLGTIGQYFTIYTYTGTYDAYVKPQTAADMAKEGSGWEPVGTLKEVMNGKSIVSGQLEEKNDTAAFAFAIHMNEDAGKDAMGAKLEGITVKLEAWQATGESDSLGGDYDNLVTTSEELAAAFTEGGKVILTEDVALEETIRIPENTQVELVLDGGSLSNAGMSEGRLVQLSSGSSLSIEAGEGQLELGGFGLVEFPNDVKNAAVTVNGGKFTGNVNGGALVRLRKGNENITVELNDVTAELTNGWVVSTSGVTAENALTLKVSGGSFKAQKGFELYNTAATVQDARIETVGWALLCGDATVENTQIVVTGAGTFADGVPAAVAVMNEKTLTVKGGSIDVKGTGAPVAALVCNSGGHLVLDGVTVNTTDPAELYRDDNQVQNMGNASSVTITNVLHNGTAANAG